MQADELIIDIFQSSLPIGVVKLDTSLRLIQHNKVWLDQVDASDDTQAGRHLYDLIPGAQSVLGPVIEKALRNEIASEDGLKLTINGTIVYWDITIAPRVDEAGALQSLLVFTTDLTDEILKAQVLGEQVDRRNERLEVLYAISHIATEVTEQEEALYACLQKVLMVTSATGAAIQLLNATGKSLRLAAHLGLPAGYLRWLAIRDGHADFIHESDSQSILIENASGDDRTSIPLAETDIHTFAALPMISKGKVVGYLSVLSERKNALSFGDISLLTSIASQIGGIVEMFRLQQEREQLLIVGERNRLARELHDAVTQSLYSLMLFAGAIKRGFQRQQVDKLAPMIERLEENAHQALKEMRLLLHNLRPIALAEAGLVNALRHRLDAVEGRAQVNARLLARPEQLDLPSDVEEGLYFIATEALNNSLKHAAATKLELTIEQLADQVTMTISDDGKGFDLEKGRASAGLGLDSIRERVANLNGKLIIDSAPGQGCTISISIPLNESFIATQSTSKPHLLPSPDGRTQ